MPTRKELIASGVEITPLTREEILLQGGEIEPLNVKERVLQGVVGGGGSSDFSTATLLLNNDGENQVSFSYVDDTDNMLVSINGGAETGSYTIPLYKGKATFMYGASLEVYQATGELTYDQENGWYVITGDCTIVVTRPKQ